MKPLRLTFHVFGSLGPSFPLSDYPIKHLAATRFELLLSAEDYAFKGLSFIPPSERANIGAAHI